MGTNKFTSMVKNDLYFHKCMTNLEKNFQIPMFKIIFINAIDSGYLRAFFFK